MMVAPLMHWNQFSEASDSDDSAEEHEPHDGGASHAVEPAYGGHQRRWLGEGARDDAGKEQKVFRVHDPCP
jgi:hypothetical protein